VGRLIEANYVNQGLYAGYPLHLGIVGKLLVVLAGYFDWLVGNTNGRFVLLVTGDAVFVVLFLDYLRRHPIQGT